MFSSRSRRFAHNKSHTDVGPGHYQPISSWTREPIRKSAAFGGGINAGPYTSGAPSGSTNIEWVRLPSAPSIPARGQALGYVQNEIGEMVPQRPGRKPYKGTSRDSVGPGAYTPKLDTIRPKNGGTSWGRYKSRRSAPRRPYKSPGPGGSTASLAPGAKTINATSAREAKGEPPRATALRGPSLNSSGPRFKGEYKTEGPGPGAYDLTYKPVEPAEYQHFNTTAPRFVDFKKAANEPGPGVYDVGSAFRPRPRRMPRGARSALAPFATSASRFAEPRRPTVAPGPGERQPDQTATTRFMKGRGSHGRNASFGITGDRFSYMKQFRMVRAPGDGAFRLARRNYLGSRGSSRQSTANQEPAAELSSSGTGPLSSEPRFNNPPRSAQRVPNPANAATPEGVAWSVDDGKPVPNAVVSIPTRYAGDRAEDD